MSMLVRSYLGRSRGRRRVGRDWQIAHQQALLTWDCAGTRRRMHRARPFHQTHLPCNCWSNSSRIGESMQIALVAFSARLHKLIKRIERMDALLTIQNGDAFRGVANDTRRFADDFRSQWPSLNRILVRESIAAYERGEYRTAEAVPMNRKVVVPQPISRAMRVRIRPRLLVMLLAVHEDVVPVTTRHRTDRAGDDDRLYRYRILIHLDSKRHLFNFAIDDSTSPEHLILVDVHYEHPGPEHRRPVARSLKPEACLLLPARLVLLSACLCFPP